MIVINYRFFFALSMSHTNKNHKYGSVSLLRDRACFKIEKDDALKVYAWLHVNDYAALHRFEN